jgi:trigger factor
MAILTTKEESATRAVLEIEIPAEEVAKAFGAVTRAYAKRAALPGFRKGKAPEAVVSKRFADEIKGDVLEHLLPDALASAVEERKLSVLGRPHVDELQWEPPGAIRFTARLDLKPVVDPGDYKGVPVEDHPVDPAEEEVAKVIDRIREAHAEFHPIEGRASAPGDFAVADIAGSFVEILAPGQNPRTFRDEKITLEVGHADSMPEINDALRGAAPGDTRSFRKTFADDFPNDEFRGKTVDYQVTLAALKEKKLPAVDDEFARAVSEGDTLETLREKVRTRLRHEKEADRRRRFRRAILERLVSGREIPAP